MIGVCLFQISQSLLTVILITLMNASLKDLSPLGIERIIGLHRAGKTTYEVTEKPGIKVLSNINYPTNYSLLEITWEKSSYITW